MTAPTHAELVSAAAKWLRGSRRHKVVLTEIASSHNEIPDVIGFTNWCSTVVEVKTSRADFFADHKKPFRRHSEMGLGVYRWYFVPRGLLAPVDIPSSLSRWGLVEVRAGRCFRLKPALPHQERNVRDETRLLVSAVERLTEGYGLRVFDHLVTDTPRRPRQTQLALVGGR
jgi:hypothetical protein